MAGGPPALCRLLAQCSSVGEAEAASAAAMLAPASMCTASEGSPARRSPSPRLDRSGARKGERGKKIWGWGGVENEGNRGTIP